MNFIRVLLMSLMLGSSLQSAKFPNEMLKKLWKAKCFTKDTLTINEHGEWVKAKYNKYTDIPLIKYFLENGEIRFSFFNFLKYPLFKNAGYVMYLRHNHIYQPVSSECKGIELEKVLAEIPEFHYGSRYAENKHTNMDLHVIHVH